VTVRLLSVYKPRTRSKSGKNLPLSNLRRGINCGLRALLGERGEACTKEKQDDQNTAQMNQEARAIGRRNASEGYAM